MSLLSLFKARSDWLNDRFMWHSLILVEEMDKLDDELRELIRKMWPVQARKKKLLNLLVPPNSGM